MPSRLRLPAALLAAAVLGTGAGLATGVFDGEPETPPPIRTGPQQPSARERPAGGDPEQAPPSAPIDRDDEPGASAGPSGPAPSTLGERSAAATMKRYTAGLDRRDGAAVCRLLSPAAVAAIRFPAGTGSCKRRLEASLGYRDPRGLPVWKGSSITDAISADVAGGSARVVATVVTTYAGVREPTVEDDIVYLEAAGKGWRLVKPSATILRAIGVADFPPSVLAPPR